VRRKSREIRRFPRRKREREKERERGRERIGGKRS